MTDTVTVQQSDWGTSDTKETVYRFILRAPNGIEVAVSNLGASLLHWLAPDHDGNLANIVLGFESPQDYLASSTHMGGVIGRWANRIADARFTLDGQTYLLEANDGNNSLHGGHRGFDRAVWKAEIIENGVRFSHRSPDGDAGFPGRVDVSIDYLLALDQDEAVLTLAYQARSDAATPLNLTNHAYFNLAATGTALDHVVRIEAAAFLATTAAGIPLSEGAVQSVDNTVLDFRMGAAIRERLESGDPIVRAAHGIDHCFVLGDPNVRQAPLRAVACAIDPVSGRELTVSTTERGLQFYTAGNLEGVVGKGGMRHHGYDAICFEAQARPNQINTADAEAVILRPGHVYRQTTVYRTRARSPISARRDQS